MVEQESGVLIWSLIQWIIVPLLFENGKTNKYLICIYFNIIARCSFIFLMTYFFVCQKTWRNSRIIILTKEKKFKKLMDQLWKIWICMYIFNHFKKYAFLIVFCYWNYCLFASLSIHNQFFDWWYSYFYNYDLMLTIAIH